MLSPDDLKKIQWAIDQSIRNKTDERENANQFQVTPIPFHVHNGSDSSPVSFLNLINRQWIVDYVLPGTSPATAGNYSVFCIVPIACHISQILEAHTTAGSDAGAVTLNIEHLTGTAAPGAGTNLLKTAFNLKATANTVQTGVLTTFNLLNLNANDRLALVLTGTPTSLANLTVMLTLVY